MPIETCDECRFDGASYTDSDLLGTLRALAPMWRTTIEGIDPAVLAQRPAEGVWSAIEYAAHSRDIVGSMGYLLHLALSDDHPRLEPPPDDTPEPAVPSTIEEAIAMLEANAARVAKTGESMSAADWARPLSMGKVTGDARWIVGHAVHDAVHHLRDVGRGLHALGAGARSQRGTVAQLNWSGGGVPKTPIESATIDEHGIVGDMQNDRKHHGRPLQALCLWSQEVIDDLHADGHSVHPGAAGENVTLAGIDWSTIRPGVRLAVGAVLAEISAFATPCAKNAQWFSDGDFHRIDHEVHPGLSRAYAWVLRGGIVSRGDIVLVEPDSA